MGIYFYYSHFAVFATLCNCPAKHARKLATFAQPEYFSSNCTFANWSRHHRLIEGWPLVDAKKPVKSLRTHTAKFDASPLSLDYSRKKRMKGVSENTAGVQKCTRKIFIRLRPIAPHDSLCRAHCTVTHPPGQPVTHIMGQVAARAHPCGAAGLAHTRRGAACHH